jgi:hypothetical protein
MAALSRRAFLRVAALHAAAVAVAGCGAAPSSDASPVGSVATGPAAAPAAPSREAPTAPPRPSAEVTPLAQDTRSAQEEPACQDTGWAREWDGVIAAARREGALSLLTMVGGGYRAKRWGAAVLTQLLVVQRPTFIGGAPGEVTEPLMQGRFPNALGVRPKALRPLQEQGRGHNVRNLDLPDADFVATISLFSLDRAPHPAAATLFANWMVTREGQTILTRSLPTNSARTDVQAFEPDRQANYRHTADTQQLVSTLLGRSA